MATPAAAQAELCRLRRDIARIEGRLAETDRLVLDASASAPGQKIPAVSPGAADFAGPGREQRGRLRLGVAALDAVLGGGLPLAGLHEVRAGESRDGGAAAGFVLALVARLSAGRAPPVMWISEADARRETGGLYAPGLAALGLDPARIVDVAVGSQAEALWAFEAALACPALAAAICELRRASLDLSATRRCALRARAAGVTGFLLRLASTAEPTAAEVRFGLRPAPAGTIGRFPAGIGRMAWRLSLEKNRGGRLGCFTVEWNAHERSFADGMDSRRGADPQPLAAAALDRPPHPPAIGEVTAFADGWLRRAS